MVSLIEAYISLIPLCVGIMVLGCTCGMLGTVLFLRKESMLGDAISHALFPGITLTFLLTQTRSPLLLFAGGIISGSVALFLMMFVVHVTKIKKETILGVILSVFFGFGFVIHSIIQKRQLEYQAAINKFLFGNAATLLSHEIVVIVFVSLIVLLLFFSQIRMLSVVLFDRTYAQVCGYSVYRYDAFLFFLLIPIIALGLHMMGVILTGTLLIAPSAISRQWTRSMRSFVLVAGIVGGFSALCGTMISFFYECMPTGPLIVVVMSIFLFFSLLFNSR